MTTRQPQILQPPHWPRPSGYSHGVVARGRQVFMAGQVGWNPRTARFESTQLADQVRQCLENIVSVLAEAGGRPENIVRMTWFVTSSEEYRSNLRDIGAAYRAVLGKHFPAISCVQVVSLMEAEAKVEIEATAVIPDAPASRAGP